MLQYPTVFVDNCYQSSHANKTTSIMNNEEVMPLRDCVFNYEYQEPHKWLSKYFSANSTIAYKGNLGSAQDLQEQAK